MAERKDMKDYKKLQNGSDIRGIAIEGVPGEPKDLTDRAVADLAAAFAAWLGSRLVKGGLTIAVGRDSRLSGAHLANQISAALAVNGVTVLDCGMASTPAMFMATVFPQAKADGAIMVTASHLPYNRNGMKFFTRDGGLESSQIKELVAIAEKINYSANVVDKIGDIVPFDLMSLYAKHLQQVICKGLGVDFAAADPDAPKNPRQRKTEPAAGGLFDPEKPLGGLKIAVDAGNGAGGFYVSKVLEPLGADCSGSQFLEPDGSFPNHQPNPENKAAMDSISAAVLTSGADLGLIFDTDVDRASAVDPKGRAIARNGIVALSAALVAEEHPGATVVTDSITSTQLHDFMTADLGLDHLRYQRGYKNVINKGIALNAEGRDCQLSIETSGHAAFKENYFLDDGAYLATKIVIKAAKLKKQGMGIDSCIEKLKEPAEAAEYRLPVLDGDFAAYAGSVLEMIEKTVGAGNAPGLSLELPNYEGVRVNADEDHGKGWFLIRKSLHEPLMPINVESDTEGGVAIIRTAILDMLKDCSGLDLGLLRQ